MHGAKGRTYAVMPDRKGFQFLILACGFPHVVAMPSQSKGVRSGVDQEVEQLWQGYVPYADVLKDEKSIYHAPICSWSSSHPSSSFTASTSASDVYQRTNAGSPKSGCMTCWTPHESGSPSP